MLFLLFLFPFLYYIPTILYLHFTIKVIVTAAAAVAAAFTDVDSSSVVVIVVAFITLNQFKLYLLEVVILTISLRYHSYQNKFRFVCFILFSSFSCIHTHIDDPNNDKFDEDGWLINDWTIDYRSYLDCCNQ